MFYLTQYSDPYAIDAHRSRVKDLPYPLMKCISENMVDTSYGNDECASFVIESSLIDGKAVRLWIDHFHQCDRSEDSDYRFVVESFTVNTEHHSYSKDDLLSYSNDDFITFFCGNEYDDLTSVLVEHVANFQSQYNALINQ